jgi:hypothetical protein
VPRQGCLEEDAHGLSPAPGGGGGRAAGLEAERRWPEPRRIEPRRPPLLFFLLLLRMVTVAVPVPRFRLESRCSHRRRVVVAAVAIVVRGDVDLGGAASLGKERKSGPLKVRPLVGPTTKSIYTVEIMPGPPNASYSVASPPPEEHSAQWVSRQTAAAPRQKEIAENPQNT